MPFSPNATSIAVVTPSTLERSIVSSSSMSEWVFIRRVLIVFAIGVLAAILWTLSDLLLLIFAAVLSALALRALMGPLMEATGLREIDLG